MTSELQTELKQIMKEEFNLNLTNKDVAILSDKLIKYFSLIAKAINENERAKNNKFED